MVRTYILNDGQRAAIIEYMRDRPNLAPQNVRQARRRAKRIDYGQMQEDIAILKKLAALDIKIGRKKGRMDLRAVTKLRHKRHRDLVAGLDVITMKDLRVSKYDSIIDEFLEGPDELVKVVVEGKDGDSVSLKLRERIRNRGLHRTLEVTVVNDLCYLQKLNRD